MTSRRSRYTFTHPPRDSSDFFETKRRRELRTGYFYRVLRLACTRYGPVTKSNTFLRLSKHRAVCWVQLHRGQARQAR